MALLSATMAKPWAYPTRFISKSSQPPPLSVVSHNFHTNTPVEGKNPIKQEIQPPSHIPAQPSPPSISREGLSTLHTGSMAQISRLRFPGALVDTYTISLTCYIAKRRISSDGIIIWELAPDPSWSSFGAYGLFTPAWALLFLGYTCHQGLHHPACALGSALQLHFILYVCTSKLNAPARYLT